MFEVDQRLPSKAQDARRYRKLITFLSENGRKNVMRYILQIVLDISE